jgi:uncharacterized cofD-like protein
MACHRACTTATSAVGDAPAVVALGGGHGLATALRAIRQYAGSITAVVSVADDGGSSGRLRRDLGVAPPGDIRRCLVALAGPDRVWSDAFEYRFRDGELEGHALGNLVLVGLAETLGSFPAALDEAGRLLQSVGRVVPATVEPVVLKAELAHSQVEGQVAVANSEGICRVELVPADAVATPAAVDAIAAADQVVYAPGSLFTSVLPVLCVGELRAAIAASPARVVQVANLRPQVPETAGLDAGDHLQAVLDHGARVDTFLYDLPEAGHERPPGALSTDPDRIRALGVGPVAAPVARVDGLAHDPRQLAKALRALL